MKYYKLVVEDENYGELEMNKVFPEDFKPKEWSETIGWNAEHYPDEWQLCEEYEYYLQEGLPEKWCVATEEECLPKELYEWRDKIYWSNSPGYIASNKTWFGGIPCNYTEISFDTFKRLILKQNDMKDREIIGYKLKEDCENYAEAVADIAFIYSYKSNRTIKEINKVISTSSICKEHLEKAGVLNLWFDAVYAEEYKVGDWVIVKSVDQGGSGNGIFTDNLIAQLCVKDISNATGILSENADFSVKNKSKYYNIKKTHIQRKATPEEIKAAQYPQIEVNGYKGEFFDDYVKFGCAKIEKAYILKINDILSNTYWKRSDYKTITSITIGKGTFTEEQIKLIAEYYINK